ncbi:MAG: hypothetical protein Ct9H300mP23_07710 [Nitrospinota bacterium]|nr:MAG: hypothetical protein Ct9H300mP23_07710 [Nitrospinota bacterium]
MALGVGVVAGVYQVILGLFRAGIFIKIVPQAAIHGLLASIGIIIIFKTVSCIDGVKTTGPPLGNFSLVYLHF